MTQEITVYLQQHQKQLRKYILLVGLSIVDQKMLIIG